jgi:hypothetical protein
MAASGTHWGTARSAPALDAELLLPPERAELLLQRGAQVEWLLAISFVSDWDGTQILGTPIDQGRLGSSH